MGFTPLEIKCGWKIQAINSFSQMPKRKLDNLKTKDWEST